jgi:hypothetical protein
MSRTPNMLAQEHDSTFACARRPTLEVGAAGQGHPPIARRQSSHRPGDPDAADLPPHRSNRVTDSPSGFDLRRGGPLSWEMLGGGNRGWGVGNEPSRSLRGSGVVARPLRSELSAEHLSLSRVNPRARARSVMESEDWSLSGAGPYPTRGVNKPDRLPMRARHLICDNAAP